MSYNQDIQDEDLDVNFDLANPAYPNLARATPSPSQFSIVPTDNDAAYYYPESVYELASCISSFSTAIAAIALLVFLLGMISGKMIGTEMMAVLQVSFFSLITLVEFNPCFRALASLWLVNGYNSVSPNDILEDSLTPEQPKGVYLFSRFLENYNLTLLLVLIPLTVSLVAFALSKTALKNKAQLL